MEKISLFEINNEVIGDYLKNLSGIIKEKQIDPC